MTDHDRISQQLCLYTAAVDTRQWQLFDRIFTPDVLADYGKPVSGLAAFKQMADAAWGAFDASQHGLSNINIRVEGDRARSLAYGNWCLIRRGLEDGDVWEGRGWYDDAFIRVDGRWLIHHRRCRVMTYTGNPGVMTADGRFEGTLPTTSMVAELAVGNLGFFA